MIVSNDLTGKETSSSSFVRATSSDESTSKRLCYAFISFCHILVSSYSSVYTKCGNFEIIISTNYEQSHVGCLSIPSDMARGSLSGTM